MGYGRGSPFFLKGLRSGICEAEPGFLEPLGPLADLLLVGLKPEVGGGHSSVLLPSRI